MDSSGIVRHWLQRSALSNNSGTGESFIHRNDSNSLITSTSIHDFMLGTGCSIYRNSILPAIETAEAEVILVTCFWAASPTLDSLNDTLRKLSNQCIQSRRKLKVRICFSSSSLFQKLFHTTSLEGRTYAPSQWQTTLGLPDAAELEGLDLEIKSVFVLPFSVMHPKFVIIDRSKVFFPSCNVSWESWFEGCVQLSGPAVDHFVNFWKSFWASQMDQDLSNELLTKGAVERCLFAAQSPRPLSSLKVDLKDVPCVFLPSPHHRNPQFALPWQSCPLPPPTPLNTFLLAAFANARNNIYIQTPNLTSPPVLSALLATSKRGVDITLVTSQRLMILEQIITAGSTTKRCVRKLLKRHRRLVDEFEMQARSRDVESRPIVRPGALSVSYYHPDKQANDQNSEPVQSHLKLTIVDCEITILGSGNMDRASWYTSQELGVAFIDQEFASIVRTQVDRLMQKRTE